MKNLLRARLFTLATMFACVTLSLPILAGQVPVKSTLPGDSVYQLDVPLLDQDGRPLHFSDGRGKPRLITMFYSSCQFVCPLIIDSLLKTEHALPQAQRTRLDVLMVSLDPRIDTPDVLKRVTDQRHLDTSRWTLARAERTDVRRIAAVLGIQYRQLQNHEFSHSSVLVLLDADGRIVARTEQIGAADPVFVAAVARLLTAN